MQNIGIFLQQDARKFSPCDWGTALGWTELLSAYRSLDWHRDPRRLRGHGSRCGGSTEGARRFGAASGRGAISEGRSGRRQIL